MKIRHLGLAAAFVLASGSLAGAMPLAAPATGAQTQTVQDQIVQVRGGCGFGEHRGPYGGCRINNGPRGAIRRSLTGLPRGCPPGMHRGYYGRCHY